MNRRSLRSESNQDFLSKKDFLAKNEEGSKVIFFSKLLRERKVEAMKKLKVVTNTFY